MHNDGQFHALRAGEETYFDDDNMYEFGTAVGVDDSEAVYALGYNGQDSTDDTEEAVYSMGDFTGQERHEDDETEAVYSLGDYTGEGVDVDDEDAVYSLGDYNGQGTAADDDNEAVYSLGDYVDVDVDVDDDDAVYAMGDEDQEEDEDDDIYGMADNDEGEDVYGTAAAVGLSDQPDDADCIYDAGVLDAEPPSADESDEDVSPTGTIQPHSLDHVKVVRRSSGELDVYSLPRRRVGRPSHNGTSLEAVSETVQYHDVDDEVDDDDIYSSATFGVETYKIAKRRPAPLDEDDYAATPSWRRGSMQEPAPALTSPNSRPSMNLPAAEPKGYEDSLRDATRRVADL
jgi:hypothetical protein